jgi:hypothetical protein
MSAVDLDDAVVELVGDQDVALVGRCSRGWL